MNVLLIPLILASVFFFVAVGFGLYAYTQMQDYKNNSDQKSAVAVEAAVAKNSSEKDNEFLEREKEPLRGYQGPAVLGNVSFKYPKTWSVYADDSGDRLSLIMSPIVVVANQKSYAMRVTVNSDNYDSSVKRYEGRVKSGKARASAYRLESLPETLGTRIDGEIADGVTGSIIILPLRDKTITISTESKDFVNDLNKIILPSFKYNP